MKLLFKTIPAIAKALSKDRAIALAIQLWYFAFTRKLKLFQHDFKLIGYFNERPITFYLRYVMDIAVLREVFVEKEYDWFPVENPKVIIDLGAHFGDTTLYYANKYPEAKIIAVEPSPENYERLLKHTKDNPNIIPVQAAVGGSDGEIELYVGKEFFGHSTFNRNTDDKQVTVPQISLQSLLRNNGIEKADLIKFDIEGAEFELFKNINPKDFASAYIGEVHLDFDPQFSAKAFLEFFSDVEYQTQELSRGKRFIFKAG